jgi:hypothetical protein
MVSIPLNWRLPSGRLAALVPFLGTVTAYIFEYGYVSFYGIPPSLIQVDLTRILKASAGILLFFVPSIMVLVKLTELANHETRRISFLGRILRIFVISSVLAWLFEGSTPWWKFVAAACVLQLLWEAYAYFFEGEKADPTPPEHTASEPNSLYSLADSYVVIPTAIFFLTALIVFAIGHRYAGFQDTHWISPDKKDMLLVSTYGDTAIFKKFNPSSRDIHDEVLIRKFSDSDLLPLTLISTGKLRKKRIQPPIPIS